MVRSIEFKSSVNNAYQSQLKKDESDIDKSENMLMFADKTTNLYSIKKEEYEQVLHENVTKTFLKANLG